MHTSLPVTVVLEAPSVHAAQITAWVPDAKSQRDIISHFLKGMRFHAGACGDIVCVLQEGIYDAFVDAVTKKVSEFKQGGGLDPSTTLGPLIGHSAVDRVRRAHLLHKAAEQMGNAIPP